MNRSRLCALALICAAAGCVVLAFSTPGRANVVPSSPDTALVDTAGGRPASETTRVPDGYFDDDRVAATVRLLTTTNDGRSVGVARWDRATVTYRLDLPGSYPPAVADEVRAAYRWASTITGVTFSETASDTADITVTGHTDNGGFGTIRRDGDALASVTIGVGCCRRHPIWEEVLHSTGFISDRGPAESLASRSTPGDTPGVYDSVVLHILYSQLEPGDSPADVDRVLRQAQ